MTVTSSTNKVIASGDGSNTVFNFPFIAVAASDISVIYTDADGVETVLSASAYTLAINAAAPGAIWGLGGTVTYPLVGPPIAVGTTLTIVRELPITQTTTISNQGALYPQVIEQALDYVTMVLQQVNETFSRAIVAPVSDPDALLELPAAAARANQAFIFDSTGQPTVGEMPATGVISAPMAPVVSAASLALGRTAFGLGSSAVENIGLGLQDNGSGSLQVNVAISAVASNQAPTLASHRTSYMATGALTFTLPRANTLFSGWEITVYALTQPIIFTPNAADAFNGLSAGASFVIPAGTVGKITTNAQAAGTWWVDLAPAAVPAPQGYLTLQSGVIEPLNDITAATSIFYTPDVGNCIPMVPAASARPMAFPFSELTLALNAAHLANQAYDIFAALVAGIVTIMTGPAWRNPGQVITNATNATPIVVSAAAHGMSNGDVVIVSGVLGNTAANGQWTVANVAAGTFELQGSVGNGAYTAATGQFASRGAGAGTTQLSRQSGLYANAVQIAGRNGATTYTVAAGLATYLGSFLVDGTNGQISLTVAPGISRRRPLFNAHNRKPVRVLYGDPTATWTYATGTWRQSRGQTATALTTIFVGLPEEPVKVDFVQTLAPQLSGAAQTADANIAVGWGAVTQAPGGKRGRMRVAITSSAGDAAADTKAVFSVPGCLGKIDIFPLEIVTNATGTNNFTGVPGMEMAVEYRA